MSIAAFAIAQSAMAQANRDNDGKKVPPKRTLTVIPDNTLIPEAR